MFEQSSVGPPDDLKGMNRRLNFMFLRKVISCQGRKNIRGPLKTITNHCRSTVSAAIFYLQETVKNIFMTTIFLKYILVVGSNPSRS